MAARVPTPHQSRPSGYPQAKAINLPKPFKLRRYYTPSEVARHNTHSDCHVSFFYSVYDLTKLLADNHEKQNALCIPIGKAAGTDITHWFDPLTQEVSQLRSNDRGRFLFHSRSAQLTPRLTWSGGTRQWAVTCTSLL